MPLQALAYLVDAVAAASAVKDVPRAARLRPFEQGQLKNGRDRRASLMAAPKSQ